MSNSSNSVNRTILAFLGIDMKNVVKVDISIRAGETPIAKIEQAIPSPDASALLIKKKRLKVVEIEEPTVATIPAAATEPAAFDLAAACTAAKHRLLHRIHLEHNLHSNVLRSHFSAMRSASDEWHEVELHHNACNARYFEGMFGPLSHREVASK